MGYVLCDDEYSQMCQSEKIMTILRQRQESDWNIAIVNDQQQSGLQWKFQQWRYKKKSTLNPDGTPHATNNRFDCNATHKSTQTKSHGTVLNKNILCLMKMVLLL